MRKYSLAATVTAAALLGLFQACGGKFSAKNGVAGEGHLNMAGNGTPYTGKKTGLKVNIPASKPIGSSFSIEVSEGIQPYSFRLINGSASVHPLTGVVTSNTVGSSLIEVTDAGGRQVQVPVVYFDPNAPTVFASCTTPWGQVIPHGVEISVFTSASVACPATCGAQLRRCNDGQFNGAIAGYAATCSVRSCVHKTASININGSCLGYQSGGEGVLCSAAQIGQTGCSHVYRNVDGGLATDAATTVCVSPDTVVNVEYIYPSPYQQVGD